jgi:ABC-type lipoprotein release transport system permease subunit
MSSSIAFRYALRSLLRHRRRTILSVLGIAVGCTVCLFIVGFVRGETGMMMRAAAESGAGHLRIAPRTWRETGDNRLRIDPWQDLLALADGTPGIVAASPHSRTDALLAMGTRTAGVTLTGVAPERELEINRLARKVTHGRYLEPDETGVTVIGRALAERLDVTLDDSLMVTAAGKDGGMRSAMLRIVGVVATGSKMLDTGLCHVSLADVEELTGRPGVGEISLLLSNPDRLPQIQAGLAAQIGKRAEVVTWRDVVPELAASVKIDETWTTFIVTVITLVVFLGIASAQLAAVLERRREFAVLAALGMKGGRLVRIMLVEGLLLGLVGGVIALAAGSFLTYLSATRGINFAKMYGNADLGISNILIDPIMYSDFGWWLIPLALLLSLGASTLSSLYPAWYAVATNPADALRVDQ